MSKTPEYDDLLGDNVVAVLEIVDRACRGMGFSEKETQEFKNRTIRLHSEMWRLYLERGKQRLRDRKLKAAAALLKEHGYTLSKG